MAWLVELATNESVFVYVWTGMITTVPIHFMQAMQAGFVLRTEQAKPGVT